MLLSSLDAIVGKISEFDSAVAPSFPGTSELWRVSGTPLALEFNLGGIPGTTRFIWTSVSGWIGECAEGHKHNDFESLLELVSHVVYETLEYFESLGQLSDEVQAILTEVV